MNTLKKVLVIAPHADDEILGCGGTINKLKTKNYEINLIICSHRLNDDDVKIAKTTSNYKNFYHLNYKDENLNTHLLIKSLEKIYEEIKPDIIFIPNKDDFNTDHQAVYKACEVVLRRYQKHQPKQIIMYEVPSSTTQSFNNNFKCNYYIELSDEDLKFKIDNFNIYDYEQRLEPNPRNENGLITYAKFRGMECNSKYAEGFNLIYSKS